MKKAVRSSDTALLKCAPEEVVKIREAVRKISQRSWALSYSEKKRKLLLRSRKTAKFNIVAAEGLESTLEKVIPDLDRELVWGWSLDSENRYFPTGEIYILFQDDTSRKEREKLLKQFDALAVDTYPDLEPEPVPAKPSKKKDKHTTVPCVAAKDQKKAQEALKMASSSGKLEPAPELQALNVPVARLTLAPGEYERVFEIAASLRALPKVISAAPDFDVFGKDISPVPLQFDHAPFDIHSNLSVNNLSRPWCLINPGEGIPHDQYRVSKQNAAVFDDGFFNHSAVTYNLLGFDAADQDFDPLSPLSDPGLEHGLFVSGLIGGMSLGDTNKVGYAPGTVVFPFRPMWSTEDDFVEIDGHSAFADVEEYLERYTSNWIEAILRLWGLSSSSQTPIKILNISLAVCRSIFHVADIGVWLNWCLRTGDAGRGIFCSAASGNSPEYNFLAIPAALSKTFAVGSINAEGSSANGLELVVNAAPLRDNVGTNSPHGSPLYLSDGSIDLDSSWMGTSGTSAIVAATASMMKTVNPHLTAEEIKTYLRCAANSREITDFPDSSDAFGCSSRYGWGMLNISDAVDFAYKNRMPAAQIFSTYLLSSHLSILIQARHSSDSPCPGSRAGLFWMLHNHNDYRGWKHVHHNPDRWTTGIGHADQVLDTLGTPWGEFTVQGRFNGGFYHSLALQLHPEEFWPQLTDHAGHCFYTTRYDRVEEKWKSLGGRSPYASGIASPQIVFPHEYPISDVVAADLNGSRRSCLVALQSDRYLNTLRYDDGSDVFLRLDPENFAPETTTSRILDAAGRGSLRSQRILKVLPVGPFRPPGSQYAQDALLCVGMFGLGKRIMFQPLKHYLTCWILYYDDTTGSWGYHPLSDDSNETHILLGRVPYITDVEVEQLHLPLDRTENSIHITINTPANQLYTVSLFRQTVDGPFTGYAVYSQELALPGRISPLQAFHRQDRQDDTREVYASLAWLTDQDHGNEIRFLDWDPVWREWLPSNRSIFHGRYGNTAVDLTALHRADHPRISDERLALLMEKPDRNAYELITWDGYQDNDRFVFEETLI